MKITGTKKILIILFALACALATALGVIFTRPATVGTVAYAETEGHTLPLAVGERDSDATSLADKEALEKLVGETGFDAEILSFFARSNGGTESQLYEAFMENPMIIHSSILDFMDAYSEGDIEHTSDISDEDWYLSPDDVSSYGSARWYADGIGLQNTWLNYYSSKPGGITTEAQYYRNSNFTMGFYVKWDNTIYSTYNYNFRRRKHSYMFYNLVWLEEGEPYTFGFKLNKAMGSGVYAEVASSYDFLTSDVYVRKYLFSGTNPKVSIDPDTSRNTYNDYLDEFSSTIVPTAASYSITGGGAVGDKRMTVKADAPSGAYMIVCQTSADNDSSGARFVSWNNTGNPEWYMRKNSSTVDGEGFASHSCWCTYATLVCRRGITKPELEFGDGVTADLTSKSVAFNNTFHQLIINGDWGPGLEDFVISEWDEATSTWKAFAKNANSTNVTVPTGGRGTRGSITKAGRLILQAKNAGKYKVELIPFRNWGNDESDRAPVEFNFTITPQQLEIPTLIQEAGVDQTTNTKTVNQTGHSLYVSIYPASPTWTQYTVSGGSLSQFTWSANGVLTLSQSAQGRYEISINLKYNTTSGTSTQINQVWADGSSGPKVFHFIIDRMKISVPGIIKDAGEFTTFTKEVTFNGAEQTISFMPVDINQLDINLTDGNGDPIDNYQNMLSIKDSTLTLTAFDAGVYILTVSVKDLYVFDDDNSSLTLTYKLTIKEMEIYAPTSKDGLSKANDYTLTVTYGGEKINGTSEDWVAKITFGNCDQSRIDWVSSTLNEYGWGDSVLELAGRSAKTYEVTFVTKKNYKWKEGIEVPTYKLVIKKLEIAKPEFIKDNEPGAEYNEKVGTIVAHKYVMFQAGVAHPFILQFNTLKSISDQNISYTKSSSVEFSYNGNFDRNWSGDRVTFSAEAAGTYTFEVYPTQNYCWERQDGEEEGSTDSVFFIFIIQPIALECLDFYAPKSNEDNTLTQYFWNRFGNEAWNKNGGYWVELYYDGTEKTIRIGKADGPDAERYITDEKTSAFAKSFYLADETGNRISIGTSNIPSDMECDESGGFLTFKVKNAGVYRIQVYLKSTDYWWAKTESSIVEYTVRIKPEEIAAPMVIKGECVGYSESVSEKGMEGVYNAINFKLATEFEINRADGNKNKQNYSAIIEIDSYFNGERMEKIPTFRYDSSITDGTIAEKLKKNLEEAHCGSFVAWYRSNGQDRLCFYARDYGTYSWVVRITDSNYAWSGTADRGVTFTITIKRMSVAGLQMRFFGDENEQKGSNIPADGVLVGNEENVRGNRFSVPTASPISYNDTYYSELDKVVWITYNHTAEHLEFHGFDVQYSYEVTPEAFVAGAAIRGEKEEYDPADSVYKKGQGFRLLFLDAGNYLITIKLNYNYRWNESLNSGEDSIGAVKFMLVINKRTIEKPTIITEEYFVTNDDTINTPSDSGSKVMDYANKYLPLQLFLAAYPNGYAVKEITGVTNGFEYVSPDKGERTDVEPTQTSGKFTLDDGSGKEVELGVTTKEISKGNSKGILSALAKSAGDYVLTVVVNNTNNYQFSGGAQEYTFRFVINRLPVKLPDAYLLWTDPNNPPDLTAAETKDSVATNAKHEKSTAFSVESENSLSVEYDGFYHSIYLYGGSIEGGFFKITVSLPSTSSVGASTMQGVPSLTTPDADIAKEIAKIGYFRLSALEVNTYTITLQFVTRDFYWEGDISSSGSTRSFKFVITRKLVDVPVIHNYENLTLNNGYSVEFEYDGNDKSIILKDVEFGAGDASKGFAVINAAVHQDSIVAPNTYVWLDLDISNKLIIMTTSLDGKTKAKAEVPHKYKIVLSIDGNNMRWNTNGEGDIKDKIYEIVITPKQIARPYIIDTLNTTHDNKFVTYTGSEWKDTLKIALMDSAYVEASLASNITMSSRLEATATVDGKSYTNLLVVSTAAPAGSYTVTVDLKDKNNYVWADGSGTTELYFTLVVNRLAVAKPSIYIEPGETEASMGVIGLTREVTYEDKGPGGNPVEHFLKVAGYWANEKDKTFTGATPDIMSFAIDSGDGKIKTKGVYTKDIFTGDGYEAYNNGLLVFSAIDAYTYIIRFALTSNAVWLDGSKDDIVVTLQVNKKRHEDMKIYDADSTDGRDEIVGNTIFYTYKLDGSGYAYARYMRIENYDDSLMTYNGLISGKSYVLDGDGYLEDSGTDLGEYNDGKSYRVKAAKAGEYVIEFELLDPDNHRWNFANTNKCTFTLNIRKLKLSQPVINSDYNLSNEVIDGKTLTVDYDKRLHTILVQSLFEKLDNGFYPTLGSKYFTVADTTVAINTAADPSYNSATHPSFFASYGNTATLKIKDLYEDTSVFTSAILNPPYVYGGQFANQTSPFVNLFRLTAYTPGEYHITFTLTDSENMEWADESGKELLYTIIINKVRHDAPTYAPGTLTSKEYTGTRVEFTLTNTFNGVSTLGGAVDGTVSEKYEIVSYYDPRTGVTTASPTGNFEVSWFNGNLTLGFTEVGSYTVKVSITDTNYITWNGTPDTDKPFVFTVAKRTITPSVSYAATGDPELDAKLQQGQTIWPISVKGGVDAQIILSGLYDVPSATTWKQRLEFKVYYENITDNVAKKTETFSDTDNPTKWFVVEQPGGTYSLVLWYLGIDSGKGNIVKGKYNLVIEQIDTDGNHYIPLTKFQFEVDADPAPFKKDMLEWVYTRSDDLSVNYYPVAPGMGQNSNNRFVLDYIEGVSYTFHIRLTPEGQKGFDGSNPSTLLAQLNSWFVTWDGSYGGQRSVSTAVSNKVTVKFTALLPDEYSFNEPPFELYYTVAKAKYDLTNLQWNYDGTTPFVYDTTNKSVAVVSKSGSMPTGLTISYYQTKGTFTSNTINGPISGTQTLTNTNLMANAGTYKTTVIFNVPSNSNYEKPVANNPNSYTGTFDWEREWTIVPKHITVDWVQGQTQTSDGNTIRVSKPAVAGTHSGKFVFKYEVEDSSQPSGWRVVTQITRTPGQVVKYRATAYLRGGSGASDYARNYTFEFVGKDNPLEFEVGGDDTVIYNHITVNGEVNTDYEYDGKAVVALPVIDMDTSNGQITPNDITVLYYRRDLGTGDKTGAAIAAPTEPGNYIVVLKLRYTNTTEAFTLSQETYSFNIIKAKLKSSEFEWHITHTVGTTTFEARYDTSIGAKWIDIVTGEEVTIDYDGSPYNVTLKTNYATTIISFSMLQASQINAGKYTSTASPTTFDTARYEFDPADPVSLTLDWIIEKHFLDLKDIKWNYEEPFVFTVVNGTPKAFAAEIENLPEYLIDKVEYTVYRGTELMTEAITNQGDYKTTVKIVNDLLDLKNYTLGTWPVAVSTTINWQIARREIDVPENDNSWSEFDGVQHNLLKSFGFDVDWAEYFSIDVTYTPIGGTTETAYDGSQKYGGKYYAYDAGTYKFTLKIHPELNSNNGSNYNVVWVVNSNNQTTKTPNDRTISYTVDKKEIIVTGWMKNNESSYVILSGNLDSSKFIDYTFYKGDTGAAGTPADLDDILNSAGGETFSMVPTIRTAYSGNITLTFEPGTEFISFVTPVITEDMAMRVDRGKPYINAYTEDGQQKGFSNEQLAANDIYVIYTGNPITFKINNWDTYYSKYLVYYSGDDLTQTEAGEYSITFILRSDLEKPLYWGKTEDNKLDRSKVVLTFKIRYRMLTVPELPAELDYTGSELNILTKVTNIAYTQLMAQYGDYVDISGHVGTNVDEYILYLTIKDQYSLAVRWDIPGYENGLIGSYTFTWKILPILIHKPVQDLNILLEYDGTAHSVFETLKGYNGDFSTAELLTLMEYVTVTGGHAVNAGKYEATLALPSNNYAWCDASGKMSADRSAVVIEWMITKCTINFGNAYWGYYDGEKEVAYDPANPFVYTVENGQVKNFTVQIFGLPDILKFYTVYRMNGQTGVNYAGKVGTHTTTVQFNTDQLDTNNFDIGIIPAEISQLVWQIVPREIALPEFDGSWKVFDGKLHDLPSLLGFAEDWDQYLDITVEYAESDSETYAPYKGEDDYAVDYSNYNGFYFGNYRLTVKLKNDGVLITPDNVKWVGGEAPAAIIIKVAELELTVTGWFDDNEYSHVIFEGDAQLSEEIADRFEYIIYADGDLNKKPLKPEDIVGGQTYFILFTAKNGSDEKGVRYDYGINLVFADGVPNPFEFGSYTYGDQPIIWLPAPVLETAVKEYNGHAQTFVIKSFEDLYKLTTTQRLRLNSTYQLGLGDNVKSYVYLQDTKSLTATAAGTYSVVVRLLSQVRLSWYDSNIYSVDASGNLLVKATGEYVQDTDALFNNKSYTLTYRITPKKIPTLTEEDLEKLMGLIVGYNGKERDVLKEGYKADNEELTAADIIAELEAKYGKIFDYAGNTGTAAGVYELIITLADMDSCMWYEGEPKPVEVNVEGYIFTYVPSGSGWKLILVKAGKDGNPEVDSAGNYIEYNDGEYTLDVAYLPEFETVFVPIDSADGTLHIFDAEGNLTDYGKYWIDGEDFVEIDGMRFEYTYITDANSVIIRYRYNETTQEYEIDPEGKFVQRIVLSKSAEAKYGYKVTVKEDATEYTYLYSKLHTNNEGVPTAIKGSDGKYVETYLYYTGTEYQLRKYVVNADGTFEPDGSGHYKFTLVESVCEFVDNKTYTVSFGKFVEDASGTGEYMLRYVLDGTNRKQQTVYAKDENGNFIVDADNVESKVYKIVYETKTNVEYTVEWKIDQSVLVSPELDETKVPQYTGKTIYAKDVLKGFLPDLMEIIEEGEGVNAGTYYAKIIITTENSKWASGEEVILVEWRIDTAKIDLSEIKWVYTDGTNTYDDCSNFVYTRVNGKAVIYWVEIANLPEALQGRVEFTTNSVKGAYAGRDAGTYYTSVVFKTDENFDEYTVPESFETDITWIIQRRVLEVPHTDSNNMIFDSDVHDLFEMIEVPEDWKEYYDIKVQYAENFVDFVDYEGHDGNPYELFGVGGYRFLFTINAGINTDENNPNVVWKKEKTETPDTGDTETPGTGEEETPGTGDNETPGTGEEETPETGNPETPGTGEVTPETGNPETPGTGEETPDAGEAGGEESTTEPSEAPESAAMSVRIPVLQSVLTANAVKVAEDEQATVQQEEADYGANFSEVCDRLKELAYGAETQLKSLRKYA